MKTDAPQKIYLQVCGDCEINDCDNCFFEDLEDNVTWSEDRIFPRDIEYIRADTFIDKVCEFLAENMKCDGYTLQTKAKFIRVFRNYMKGE